MNIFQQTFSAQAVAKAVGCEAKQISDWCNTGRSIGQRQPLGTGRSRQFSWFNVMEIAIATELMNIGIKSPQDAFAAAQMLSHTNDGDERALVQEDGPERHTALPYHHSLGTTFLFVSRGAKTIILSEDGSVNLFTVARPYSRAIGYIVVNVNEVCAAVLHRLGHDYRVILDEAYSVSAA